MSRNSISGRTTPIGLVGVILVGILTGCAGAANRSLDRAHPAEAKAYCRSGGTPMCFERLGKPVSCTCATRDDLVRLLDGK
jgi:hypothetical protein